MVDIALVLAAAVTSVSTQPLTDLDLQNAIQQIKKTVDEMPKRIAVFPVYSDRRTPTEKQELQKFRKAWAKVDRAIAPFLGNRQIVDEHSIYPSHVPHRVCIVESYWRSDTDNGIKFSTGKVKNSKIYTTDNQVLLVDRGYLGIISMQGNKPQIRVLPFPTPLKANNDMVLNNPAILQQFIKAECTAALP